MTTSHTARAAMTPAEMIAALGRGLLSFPVTAFRADDPGLGFDEPCYRAHLERLCGYPLAGLFAAGGTGEFFSLTPAEVATVTRVAVEQVGGRMPVLGAAGYGTALACEMARAAEAAGADGILLLPPYLVGCEQQGLEAHVAAVCAATRLGVIIYSRANALYDENTVARLAARCPNLVGYKDGRGDLELITRVHARLGDRLGYIGGLPTAETFARPYLELGVTTYSSAMFNFVPAFATRFYAAVRSHDREATDRWLREFVLPLIAIRNRRKGYAVAMIKAGLRLIGHDCGPVRPPLHDLTPTDLADLDTLLKSSPVTNLTPPQTQP